MVGEKSTFRSSDVDDENEEEEEGSGGNPVADAYVLEELEKIATWLDILIMGDFNAPHIDWSSPCAHSSDLAFNTRNKDPIPLLKSAEGKDLTEDSAKADHLSEFFWSVFTKKTRYDYPTDGFEIDTIVETVNFTETLVLKDLLGLKESKSPGPDEVAKPAMSIPYLVKRAFAAFTTDCLAQVFGKFVRLQLESAIRAGRLWAVKDVSILEKVQTRATKLVLGHGSQPYETRLSNLNLFPLRYRQLCGDLILKFRILRVKDCCLVLGDFFE
ncbi:unnamed protein product [Schistocephalus solidus]|uniref:Endo/exonuclease/phosphatase domain-containing protein n=1 Tax=Schistocephalus solidus TaxID=70667 RepID=A0A183TI90_SCHSO|nr:unnamed protein product [Schistocephalus solidus]